MKTNNCEPGLHYKPPSLLIMVTRTRWYLSEIKSGICWCLSRPRVSQREHFWGIFGKISSVHFRANHVFNVYTINSHHFLTWPNPLPPLTINILQRMKWSVHWELCVKWWSIKQYWFPLSPAQARFLLPLTSAKTNTSGNRDREKGLRQSHIWKKGFWYKM